VYDEDTPDRPRRRPVLLAMLVAAALLLALAGSGAVAGNNGGTARSSDEGTSVTRDSGAGSSGSGQGFTHRGRHCHHDQNQGPQQDPTGAPPV
jgi:hypothetical protein